MSYKILLVDDEIDFLDVVGEFLEFENYTVDTAINAEIALDKLEKREFDLVISDINMPGMKGYDFLKQVSLRYPKVKRVLITAYDVRDYIRYAKNFDIGNIMVKTTPFNFEELSLFVSNLLTGNIFALSNYVNGDITTKLIHSVSEIENSNREVLESFNSEDISKKFRQGLGEILINAFFYGAKNEHGNKKHLWDMDAVVNDDLAIKISWGQDETKQAISICDQTGRLTKADILFWIERNTTKDVHGASVGMLDTHGKGIFITREIVDRMIINIDPGKRTEIILLNYKEGLYEGYRPLWIQEL